MIDRAMAVMSLSATRMIRLGAIFAWVLLASVSIYYSWTYGIRKAPASGQDLSMALIREKAERERNLKNPPELNFRERHSVIIPETGEYGRGEPTPVPYERERRRPSGLLQENKGLYEPMPKQHRKSGPTYRGERRESLRTPYPRREYIPEKDRGSGGVRREPGEERDGKKRNTRSVRTGTSPGGSYYLRTKSTEPQFIPFRR